MLKNQFVLAAICTAQQEVKKSRFMAIAAPVSSITAAREFLAAQYDATATHQCWAWKISGQSRMHDDGEPCGTAGKPILAVIAGQQLDNVIVLVNRWYGGIKLGTGGLMRAYGSTVQQCLLGAVKMPLLSRVLVEFSVPFSQWAVLQHYLTTQQLYPQQVEYHATGVKVVMQVPKHQLPHWDAQLKRLSAGQHQFTIVATNPD